MALPLFETLCKKLNYLDPEKIAYIERAFLVAKKAHEGQVRKTGEPYITHPLAVACILASLKMDPETIIAGILHDVLEDTLITKQELTQAFGKTVAELVDGVTKLSKIQFKSKAEAQADYFRKMILAMSKDIRVILVKLSDRLHNMQTLQHLPLRKQRQIAQETLEIFSPIANRLGMRQIADELEELCFSALYPYRYQVIKKAMQKAKGNREEIFSLIEKTLRRCLEKQHIPLVDFFGREKQIYSVYKKMSNRNVAFTDIMDIYGFRIVVKEVDECYRALGAVHSIYKPMLNRFKDYIAIPKANGYQAIHTTLFGPKGVPIEVQIRTQEMNFKADSGIAAHWLYKAIEEDHNQSHLRAQQWVKSLIEMQQRTGSSLEFIENFKIDLFPDEIYVFTPRGDIMELPKGATVVDFAYAVHTDIGNHCISAKVNRRAVPLSTHLANGQTVAILTSSDANPNPAWLEFVSTAKARSNIRHYLKTQEKNESIQLGHQLLDQALAYFSLKLESVQSDVLEKMLAEVNLSTLEDLWVEIGLGYRSAVLEAHRIKAILEHKSFTDTEANMELIKESPLAIAGTEGMLVKFASCCSPIPGDLIAGLLQKGKGIEVHVQQCKVAQKHLSSSKYVLLRWSEDVSGEFTVSIQVDVLDHRGILADMAVAISLAGADIEDVQLKERSDSGHYKALFQLKVRNRIHLARVIRNLRKLKPVLHIFREKLYMPGSDQE